MAKTSEDPIIQQVDRIIASRESYDDLLSRIQAIEEVLVEKLSIPKRSLNRHRKTIRKELSEKHRAEVLAFAMELKSMNQKRLRKMLDKASGPVQ